MLLILAGLFLASILAHRYWRAKIRLEDELEAQHRDAGFAQSRYLQAWRRLQSPSAFVDRGTGFVIEVTQGWVAAGLPGAGQKLYAQDGSLEEVWKAFPPPDGEGRPGDPREVRLQGSVCLATPLEGASLGIVLVEPKP